MEDYVVLIIITSLIVFNVITFIWGVNQQYKAKGWKETYHYIAECYDDIIKEYGVLGGDEEK